MQHSVITTFHTQHNLKRLVPNPLLRLATFWGASYLSYLFRPKQKKEARTKCANYTFQDVSELRCAVLSFSAYIRGFSDSATRRRRAGSFCMEIYRNFNAARWRCNHSDFNLAGGRGGFLSRTSSNGLHPLLNRPN